MATSEYYWNCGIFVWRAQTILDALKEFCPEIHERLERLRPAIGTDKWQTMLETEFPKMPSISIDYAVLEKAAGRVCVLQAPFEWDDFISLRASEPAVDTFREELAAVAVAFPPGRKDRALTVIALSTLRYLEARGNRPSAGPSPSDSCPLPIGLTGHSGRLGSAGANSIRLPSPVRPMIRP